MIKKYIKSFLFIHSITSNLLSKTNKVIIKLY